MSSEIETLSHPFTGDVSDEWVSSDVAIHVRNVSKCYHVYDRPEDRLKQSVIPRLQRLVGRQSKNYFREFWALKDVSFEIKKGEAVGIVGRNGSGKSTLLQIICGTLAPTDGVVETNGRIAALLELGSGFNPEFTGRENVYMNGAVLGLSKEEIDARFDDIAAFADIGDFIEQPVKTYSSGMFVRLAFAVQASLTPDILIVDEALSVGDQFFQAKCYSAIRAMMDRGCTVLLVSHSAATVKALCRRAILIDSGRQILDGPSDKVLDRYFVLGTKKSEALLEEHAPGQSVSRTELTEWKLYKSQLQPPFLRRISERIGSGKARFVDCLILSSDGETTLVTTGESCTIRAILDVHEDCPYEGEIGVVVATLEGVELFAINSFFQNCDFPPLAAGRQYMIDFHFVSPLSTGARYRIDVGYRMPTQGEYVDKVFGAAVFDVANKPQSIVPLLFHVPGRIEVRPT